MKRRGRHSRQLVIEPLEKRDLFAITVDTIVDEADGSIIDGDISLRDALALAPPNETIDFSPSLTAGGPVSIILELGDLDINKGVTIEGPGSELLTIDATGSDPTPDSTLKDGDLIGDGDGSRIFTVLFVDLADSVTLSGLTLTGGDSGAGGGAIHSQDTNLTIQDSVISGNEGQSAVNATASSGTTVRINNSRVEANFGGDGQGLNVRVIGSGRFYLTDSILRNNGYSGYYGYTGILGGGMFLNVVDGGFAEVQRTVITGNTAGQEGGGMYIVNDDLINPNEGGTVRILTSTISGNQAGLQLASVSGHANGGGILLRTGDLNPATPTINLIQDSTISGNASRTSGGGIAIRRDSYARVSVINSTISGNESIFGGGISVSGGGSPTELLGAITIAHSTIARNIAYEDDPGFPSPNGSGGGIALIDASSVRETQFDHVIMAENLHVSDGGSVFSPDIRTDISSEPLIANYTLIGNSAGIQVPITGTGNLIDIAPILGDLTNNGGLTLTHLPQAGSPAIDAGDPSAVAGVGTIPEFDQRGDPFGRVADGDGDAMARIDIGAVEVQRPGDPDCNIVGDYNRNGTVDSADYTVWRDHLGQDFMLPNEDPIVSPGMAAADDYDVWKQHFGESCEPAGSGASVDVKLRADDVPSVVVDDGISLVAFHAAKSPDILAVGSAHNFRRDDFPFALSHAHSHVGFSEDQNADLLNLAIARRRLIDHSNERMLRLEPVSASDPALELEACDSFYEELGLAFSAKG